jgi:ferredoxin-NADP reductase
MYTAVIDDVRRGCSRAHLVRLRFERPFCHEAGQAVLVGAPGGDRRYPYSIASPRQMATGERCIELLVGTDGPHATPLLATPGLPLVVEGPAGTFVFPRGSDASQLVFLAGGTGIAPLRSMLHEALATAAAPVTLLYSARDRDDFAFEDELSGLAAERRIRLTQTITRGRTGTDWTGMTGRLCPEMMQDMATDPSALWFAAGPRAFVVSMRSCLASLGVEAARVRVEQWGAAVGTTAAAAVRPEAQPA